MMGCRVLIQLKSSTEFSPVLYLHYDGYNARDFINQAERRMGDRKYDIQYAFARLVQIAAENGYSPDGNLGVGIWNKEDGLMASDSHGDAGCYVVDVDSASQCWKITHMCDEAELPAGET